ncbi:MAG: hypothetical protein JJU02_11690 [Cryomorphaceae bacterium]|nr:hypothetical protein [Cryomorphaceae bacterium]
MRTIIQLLVGLLSLIPFTFTAIVAINAVQTPDARFIEFQTLINWLLLVVLVMIGLISYFVVHIFNTDKIPTSRKTFWTIILFFGHVIAIPVYWFLFIWGDGITEKPS